MLLPSEYAVRKPVAEAKPLSRGSTQPEEQHVIRTRTLKKPLVRYAPHLRRSKLSRTCSEADINRRWMPAVCLKPSHGRLAHRGPGQGPVPAKRRRLSPGRPQDEYDLYDVSFYKFASVQFDLD